MLEIACFNASSAIAASKAGADRIELCADYAAGGVTPGIACLDRIREVCRVPIRIMIRPRGGDFNYTKEEFERMKREIVEFRDKADGFVFGVLDSEGAVDEWRNSELVRLAAPLPCTFHRAIDGVEDLEGAVETVIKCEFKSILTSGGEATADGGAEKVALLQKKFGDTITIILGGGVRSANAAELRRRTGVEWLHSAAIMQPGEEVDSIEVARIRASLSHVT